MAMTEKKLIDANALTDEIEKTNWYHINKSWELAKGANSLLYTPLFKADDIFEVLDNAPTVDAVEVVRCKDCIHYESGVCLKIYSDGAASKYAWQIRKEDDFCSYGERKEACLNRD